MDAFAVGFFSKDIRLLIARETQMAGNPGKGHLVVRGIKLMEKFFNIKNGWDRRGDKVGGLVDCLKDAE